MNIEITRERERKRAKGVEDDQKSVRAILIGMTFPEGSLPSLRSAR